MSNVFYRILGDYPATSYRKRGWLLHTDHIGSLKWARASCKALNRITETRAHDMSYGFKVQRVTEEVRDI